MLVVLMGMSLASSRRAVVAILGISFSTSLATGLLKFPELTRLTSGLPLPFNSISLIHDWSGIVLSAAIMTHLLLHWGRVARMFGGAK